MTSLVRSLGRRAAALAKLLATALVAGGFGVYATYGQDWIEGHLGPFAIGSTVVGGILFATGLVLYACDPVAQRGGQPPARC